MTSGFDRYLDAYAEVIIQVGLGIRPGQRLLIGTPSYGVMGTPLEAAPLIRLIAKKAYQAGARFVEVLWNDDQLRLIRYQHAPRDSFEHFPTWRTQTSLEFAREGDAILVILAENPDLLTGQDPELIATALQVGSKHHAPIFNLASKYAMNRTLVSAPVSGWADKVFPDLPAESREERLWDAIFEICRIKQEDPVAAWRTHLTALIARCEALNQRQFIALKLTGPGTNLTVGLPGGHRWTSTHNTTQSGIEYTSNIPTEEVYTIPHKDQTVGVVTATKPLRVDGSLVEGMCLTFSQGRVVKAVADKGQEVLLRLLDTDGGARQLGEVALVPHSSPISQSGLVFYNTLYDENASSHLALGQGYRYNLENGVAMTDDQFAAAGGNRSVLHIDFMIGSGEMDVDGIAENGSAKPLMRGGEWAFKL
jgi:aminopeptidase